MIAPTLCADGVASFDTHYLVVQTATSLPKSSTLPRDSYCISSTFADGRFCDNILKSCRDNIQSIYRHRVRRPRDHAIAHLQEHVRWPNSTLVYTRGHLGAVRLLKRYWFNFDALPQYNPLRLGCGVIAYNYDDALALLSQSVFKHRAIPSIKNVIENLDVSTLDQGHVIPNMEAPVWRGVWFPKGYRLLRGR